MTETIQTISNVIILLSAGSIIGAMALFSPLIRKRQIRAKAELRRQARAYQQRIAELEASHAAEVAALRESIRFETSKLRPHDAVARCIIQKKPLLNKSEYRVFARLNALVSALPNGERLFAQVALVEVFSPRSIDGSDETRRAGYEAYGNMRCDFLIVNRAGYPVCGIEYQGKGHHQANFAYREQIKREVFRKAGVPLVEVGDDDPWPATEAAIKAAIRAPLLAA